VLPVGQLCTRLTQDGDHSRILALPFDAGRAGIDGILYHKLGEGGGVVIGNIDKSLSGYG